MAGEREKSNTLRGAWWIMLSVVTASIMTLGARGAYVELDSRMLVMLRHTQKHALALHQCLHSAVWTASY